MTNKLEISRELAERLTKYYPSEITDQETMQAIRIEALAALDELRALLAAPAVERQELVALTVREGPMPESNGKSNFTAILMRKDATFLDGITGGLTIARSEYPDRVRYEADCMRYMIGEIDSEPCVLDYDTEKHSGYVKPEPPAPVAVALPERKPQMISDAFARGWNACLDKVKEMNR